MSFILIISNIYLYVLCTIVLIEWSLVMYHLLMNISNKKPEYRIRKKPNGEWINVILSAVLKVMKRGSFWLEDLYNNIEWPKGKAGATPSVRDAIQSWAWNGSNVKNKDRINSFFTYTNTKGFWEVNFSSKQELCRIIQNYHIDIHKSNIKKICEELLKTRKLTMADEFITKEDGEYFFETIILDIQDETLSLSELRNDIKLDNEREPLQIERKIFEYKRSSKISEQAKVIANYQCAMLCDMELNSFKNSNEKYYVETHHLLPMNAQKYYDFNIDREENVICLCPKHHKEIHLGYNRQSMIKKLFSELNDSRKWFNDNLITLERIIWFYSASDYKEVND